jgi:hypothetical protein
LKHVYWLILDLLREALLLPYFFVRALFAKRSDTPESLEAERLDRIRNPSKYLGKS